MRAGNVFDYKMVRNVVLECSPEKARLIAEREWFPGQKTKHLPDGGLRLRVPAVPSPFAGSTDLVFTGPRATEAQLVIVDASGRRVRSAWQGALNGRTTTVPWDGRDDSGRDAPSGVYLARLKSGSASVVVRLVKAR